MSRREGAPSRRWSAALLSCILSLGGLGYVVGESSQARGGAVERVDGFRVLAPDGDTRASSVGGALRLGQGVAVELVESLGAPTRATVDYRPERLGSVLEVVLGARDGGKIVARLGARDSGGVQLLYQRVDARERELARGTAPAFARMAPLRLSVLLEAGAVVVRVNGREAGRSAAPADPDGAVAIRARGGSVWLDRFEVIGEGAGEAAVATFDPSVTKSAGNVASTAFAGLRALALVIFACLFLRALCSRRPPFGRSLRASAALLAPVGLLAAVSLVTRRPIPLEWISLASLPGLAPAMFLLRDYVRAPSGGARATLVGAVVAAAALVGVAAVAVAAARFDGRLHAAERSREDAAARSPALGRPAIAAPGRLGPENQRTLEGPFRSFDLRAQVALEPGGVLQLRLRASDPDAPLGTSVFVSADPAWPSRIADETRAAIDTVQELEIDPVQVAAGPRRLDVSVRGRRVEVRIDGAEVGAGETRLHPRGAVVALAAAGTLRVEELSVTPVASPPPPSRWVDRAWVAARAAVACAALALLLAMVLGGGPARGLWLAALASAPVGVFLATVDPAAPGAPSGVLPVLASASLAAIALSVRAGGGRRWRWAVAVLGVVVLGAATFVEFSRRAWPASSAEVAGISWLDVAGAGLAPGLEHLQHPKLRRWNGYLARHEFRGRAHPVRPPAGVTRLAVLGTSSSWGYGVDQPWGFRLERALSAGGRPTEVLIAAVQGGCVAQQRVFYENVVRSFAPSVVVASFFYNDAVELSQIDVDAWLDSMHDGSRWRRRVLSAQARPRVREEVERLNDLMEGASPSDEERSGAGGPPARFERALTRLVAAVRADGADVVLVREPSVQQTESSRPRPWMAEFGEAMANVAERHGVPLVDPWPILERKGGAALFQDAVHPTEEGHRVMAEALLPAVEEVLARRGS